MERKIRNPIYVIIFSIISCGIYLIYWTYVTNQQINELLGAEDVSPALSIVGCFCWPVLWYVWYKWDKSLLTITEGTNARYNSNFVLWVVLSIVGFGHFVTEFQVQDTLNSIYEG
jgi:hypothetical protein